MKILDTTISRERFAVVCILIVFNVVAIAAHSYYVFQRVPTWVYLIYGCLLAATIVFGLIDYKKSKGRSNSGECT